MRNMLKKVLNTKYNLFKFDLLLKEILINLNDYG